MRVWVVRLRNKQADPLKLAVKRDPTSSVGDGEIRSFS